MDKYKKCKLFQGKLLKDGQYEIISELGLGAFSTVYLAKMNQLVPYRHKLKDTEPTNVAIKIIKKKYTIFAYDEIKILQCLKDTEYIIKMYDNFTDNNLCIVTEVVNSDLLKLIHSYKS